MPKPFYITTPIFYPNAKLHLGHAYTTTISDIIARYHRDMLGEETYFLTGSDENTQKVVQAAKEAGQDPKVFLDRIVANFKILFTNLNISADQFIRTSDEKKHWPGAQMLWKKLVEAGDIEKRQYEGLYCVGHEAFITEKDLVDGKCPDHNIAPELIREENYFFKLSKYTKIIKEKITSGELKIIPETRKNEILSLLNDGLQDVSFSRPKSVVSFGIPVPEDDSQVMYVWCDALSNYITALGYGVADDSLYKKFWPADVHVIGKDILRFHAAIWPAMIISAGLPLPKSILVHGLIRSGGKKMSKSLGNIIDPEELIAEYGAEAVRYYIARHISLFEDGEITRESFKEAYNAGLANGLGNLVSRVMKMASTHLEKPVEIKFDGFTTDFKDALDNFDIQKATHSIVGWIANTDSIIQVMEPFKLIKTDKAKAKEIIEKMVTNLFVISRYLEPFMPETAKTIQSLIKENKMPEKPLFARKD